MTRLVDRQKDTGRTGEAREAGYRLGREAGEHGRYTEAEIRAAVDAMVREDDYTPEDAQRRLLHLLRTHPHRTVSPDWAEGLALAREGLEAIRDFEWNGPIRPVENPTSDAMRATARHIIDELDLRSLTPAALEGKGG